MKKTAGVTLLILFFLSGLLKIYAQGIQLKNAGSKYPTFDKLFKLKWKFEDDKIRPGKLLVYNGIIFCPGITGYCLEGESGQKKWIDSKLKMDSSGNDFFITVYKPINYERSIINISKGKTVYNVEYDQCPSFLLATRLLKDSLYYYATEDNYIKAKNLNQHRLLLWKFPVNEKIRFKHIRYDSTFIVFSEKKLLLLNVLNGAKEWETGIEKLISDPVMLGDNLLFIAKNEQQGSTLYSIDLKNRKKNWTINVFGTSPYFGLAAGSNKVCYVTDKGVHVAGASTGKELYFIKGNYETRIVSIVGEHAIVYNNDIESIQIGTGININTGKIEYQYFTSDGFPAKGEGDMNEHAKAMKERGEPDWWEGLGYNYLDGTDVNFTKDPKTGLVYANGGGIVYCFEYLK